MNVEAFEFENEADVPEAFKTGTEIMPEQVFPQLVELFVKNKIFSSKSEARRMITGKGVSYFCYEGNGPMFKVEGDNYKTIDGKIVANFNDKSAVLTDPNVHFIMIPGDVVKIGSRRFIKITETV